MAQRPNEIIPTDFTAEIIRQHLGCGVMNQVMRSVSDVDKRADQICCLVQARFIFLAFRCVLMTLINLDNILSVLIALRHFSILAL